MIRGLWTRETVAIVLLAAYLPLALFWLWFGGMEEVQRLALAALVLAIWHLVFLLARAQRLALAAAIQPAKCRRVAFLVCTHAAGR